MSLKFRGALNKASSLYNPSYAPANVSKSAVMVFSKNSVEGGWKWGEHRLPKVSSYSYLGIDFASNGAWDVHLKKVLDNGRKKA